MEAEKRTVSKKGNDFWALISFDFTLSTYEELTELFQVHFHYDNFGGPSTRRGRLVISDIWHACP